MSRIIHFILSLAVLLVSNPVFAQDVTSPDFQPPIPTIAQGGEATGPLSCFDYYTFGSVQADLQPMLAQTVPGVPLLFDGEVKNANPYPLLDGTLYVKIFKRNETTFAEGDGNEVVDQFVIKDGIALPPKGTLPLSYEWKVPVNAEGGEYYAAYFFTTAKRYNLMGLSFTDDVVGNQASFTVVAENTFAKLSKIDTALNGKDHRFAASPLHFAAGDEVTVTTTITNPSTETRTLPLQWNQYAWDAMLQDNLRFSKTELVTLAPNETKTVTYTVQPQRESVVYVTGVAQDNEAKSVLDIRFVRDGIEETRINFPGITKFPLEKEVETVLFACAHSTNLPVVPGNILTLTLKDKDGAVIHTYTYEGSISGSMAGYGETFIPQKNINYATLTATLERNGVIVEEVIQTYDCTAIDSNSCLPEESSASGTLFDFLMKNTFTGVLVVLLLIGIIGFVVYKKSRTNADLGPKMTTPMAILFFTLLAPSVFLLAPQQTQAKSVMWNTQYSNAPYVPYSYVFDDHFTFHYCWNRQWNQPVSGSTFESKTCSVNRYEMAMLDPNVTITYTALITNVDTGTSVSDGESLPVGTRLRLQTQPHDSSDISWFATGYSQDSPNGDWVAGAPAPAWKLQPYVWVTCPAGTYAYKSFFDGNYYCDDPATWLTYEIGTPTSISVINSIGPECKQKDFVGYGTGTFAGSWAVHVPFVVNPPSAKTTSVSSNLTCDAAAIDGNGTLTQNCTVNATGAISVTFNIPATYGKFYYRYWDTMRTVQKGNNFVDQYEGCYGNDNVLRTGRKSNPSALASSLNPDYGPFQASIPAQSIVFNLTAAPAVPANNPPVTTITGPTNGSVNTPYTFGVRGDDPESNTVRVGVDWNMDGAPDTGSPYGNFSPSGTVENFSYTWTVPGTYTFQANSQDSASMGISPWRTHTITIAAAPAPTANLTINGSDGPLNVPKNTTVNLSWTGANAASCSKWGGTWGSGESVGLTGNGTTVVSATTDYVINCGGATDTVRVNVVNQTPSAPGISYVSGTRETGQTLTFSIQGTDPDGDNIFYEVDWDNNGSVDATTMTVPSGNIQNANHSWSTVGVVTFQARTVDIAGARSGWTSHSETLSAAPAPTTTFEVQVNTNGWTTTNPSNIDVIDSVNVKWSSANATVCDATAGPGFSTSDQSPRATSGTDLVTTPNPGQTSTYTVTCTGPGGSDSKSITVQTGLPNLTEPIVTNPNNGTFDTANNWYNSFNFTFRTENSGQSATNASADYRIEYDNNGNGSFDAGEYSSTVSNGIGTMSRGGGVSINTAITGPISFGPHRLRITVDSSGNPGKVSETNENDNVYDDTVTILPPDPGLSLTTDKTQVRHGDIATITWDIVTRYPMNCSVTGPGVNSGSFNPETATLSASDTTDPVTAKSEYTMRCTDLLTPANTWTDTVTVESVGEIEEI